VTVALREKRSSDGAALAKIWTQNYGGPSVVSRGHELRPLELAGFVAVENDELIGAVTWSLVGDQFEVVTLDSWREDRGVGSALLGAAVEVARKSGARRAWLITSNDNIRALRFYQTRGWDMVAVHHNAVTEARKSKPTIPEIGDHGIPVRHEIEFELRLRPEGHSTGIRPTGHT
jgi:ribosomal protein S18 acetylase RimI-like enzyme